MAAAGAAVALLALLLLPTGAHAWAHYMASMMCQRPLAEGEILMGYPAKVADGPDDLEVMVKYPAGPGDGRWELAARGAALVQAKVGDEFLLELSQWPSEFVFDVDRGLELETADGSTFDIAVCDNKRRIANERDVVLKVVEPGGTPALRVGYAHGYEQVSITAEVVFQVAGQAAGRGRGRVPGAPAPAPVRTTAAESAQKLEKVPRGIPGNRQRRQGGGGAPRAEPPRRAPKDIPDKVKGGGWFTGGGDDDEL